MRNVAADVTRTSVRFRRTNVRNVYHAPGGCAKTGLEHDFLAPPGYTSSENAQRIGRYIAYDFSQAIDDFDKDVLMTRPSSRLTLWDVSQSD